MGVFAQVWACLLIAHILQAICMEEALRADIDLELPLVVEAFPPCGSQGRDGRVECVRQGRLPGMLRPSTRVRMQALENLLIPVPEKTPLYQEPRRFGKNRTTVPIIADQQSTQGSGVYPTYRKSSESESKTRTSAEASGAIASLFPLPDTEMQKWENG